MSWGGAVHAVNGLYKSTGYSCRGPFGKMTRNDDDCGVHEDVEPTISKYQMRKVIYFAGEYVLGTECMYSQAGKKRKNDTVWLIGKDGTMSILRKRPKGWKFENIKHYINVDLADSVKEVQISDC